MIRYLVLFLFLLLTISSPTHCFFFNIEFINNVIKNSFNVEVISNLFKNLFTFTQDGINLAQEFKDYDKKELRDTTPVQHQEYDYVIVGAGSAGATIAARLSEIKQASVLLVEAGGHENLLVDVPLLAIFLQLDKNINWDYSTEPSNEYCLAMENHQCKWPRGKIMGGSSSLNFMIATRGTKKNYDEWAQLTGDQSWSYREMLKYFKKLESHAVSSVNVDPSYHNTHGPLSIVDPPYSSPLVKAFRKAGKELGFPPNDYNGANMTGFNYVQTNQIKGERMSTNRAYLHPIKSRKNLHLSLNSHVNKILINPITKTAYGVEFSKAGKKINVIAKKEVILSAGAIGSSQILMLSGVGPAKNLRNVGVNVLVDSPVGENLMDHVAYGGLTFFVNTNDGIVIPQYVNSTNQMIARYLTQRTGEVATAGGVEGLGFVNTDDPKASDLDPNMELLFLSASLLSGYSIHLPMGLKHDFFIKYVDGKLYRHAYAIWPILQKPKSRGKILLRNKNPKAHPKIIPNYYSHPDDIRVMIKGIRMAIKVSKTQAMQRYGSVLHNRPIPGCEQHKYRSDAYWECALRTFTLTLYHPTGTCKMGREDDPTAVVNSKLQVKGINKLRVVDASVVPNIPTGHPNIPIIAIAEKLADIIKIDGGYI